MAAYGGAARQCEAEQDGMPKCRLFTVPLAPQNNEDNSPEQLLGSTKK